MTRPQSATKILIVEQDDISFEFFRSLAEKLEELPPVELFHARDATEALALLESIAPDVLLIDDHSPEESELLLDSLASQHPPVVLCTEDLERATRSVAFDELVTCIERNESLEGLHQQLKIAAALGMQAVIERSAPSLH